MQFAKLINHLTAIGHGHPDMLSVVQGDYEKILSLENGELEYPFYWVETPDIGFGGDSDDMKQESACAIIIGMASDPKDDSARLYVQDATHNWILQIVKQLDQDNRDGKITDINVANIKIEAITINADNAIGWRAEVPILQSVCASDVTIAEIQHPSFTYDAETNTIAETPNTTLSGYARYWRIWKDGLKSTSESTDDIFVDADYSRIYIELIYEGKHHELKASMDFEDDEVIHSSVPYSHNPFLTS